MYEYSPVIYRSHLTKNVLTKAIYDEDEVKDTFYDNCNEDVAAFVAEAYNIPPRYNNCYPIQDCFMKPDWSLKKMTDYTQDELWQQRGRQHQIFYMNQGESQLELQDSEIAMKERENLASISKIGIGRAGFTPTPIKTLIIATFQEQNDLTLDQFYNLANRKSVLENFPIARHVNDVAGDFIEFKGDDGPLLWFQFSGNEYNQFEIELSKPRSAAVIYTLLVDSENRMKEYDQEDQGIDIAYVVFAGKHYLKSAIV